MHTYLTSLSRCIAVLIVLSSCETSGTIQTETTTSRSIEDTSADTVNKAVRDNAETVLVLRLDISHGRVSLGASRFARVPKGYLNTREAPDQLLIKALDEQRRIVGNASAADGSVNVQEGRGQVILDEWSVSVAVPVIKAPSQLAVVLPDAPDAPVFLNVAERSKLYCEQFPQDDICSSTSIDTLPLFRLDSTTENEAIANPPEQ